MEEDWFVSVERAESDSLENLLATTCGIEAVEARDISLALALSVNLLEPTEQELLSLVYLRGRGIEGAARELGTSRHAANMRIVRARRSLGRRLMRWTYVIG